MASASSQRRSFDPAGPGPTLTWRAAVPEPTFEDVVPGLLQGELSAARHVVLSVLRSHGPVAVPAGGPGRAGANARRQGRGELANHAGHDASNSVTRHRQWLRSGPG